MNNLEKAWKLIEDLEKDNQYLLNASKNSADRANKFHQDSQNKQKKWTRDRKKLEIENEFLKTIVLKQSSLTRAEIGQIVIDIMESRQYLYVTK